MIDVSAYLNRINYRGSTEPMMRGMMQKQLTGELQNLKKLLES